MAAYFNRRKSSHSMVNLNSFKLDIPRKDSDGSVGGDFMSPMDTTANRIFFVEKPVVNPPPQAHHNGIDSQLRPGLLPDTSQGSTLPNCSTASLPSFNSTSTLANSAASSPVHTNEKEKLNASGTVCPKCQYGSTTVQDSPKASGYQCALKSIASLFICLPCWASTTVTNSEKTETRYCPQCKFVSQQPSL